LQGFLGDAVAEEQTACFDGGTEEGGGDAAVETSEAVAVDGLAETVEGAGVQRDGGVWLGLEADFYGVEGVFDELADYACCLREEGTLDHTCIRMNRRNGAYRAICYVLEGFHCLAVRRRRFGRRGRRVLRGGAIVERNSELLRGCFHQ
jgi:hypothetical protein